MSKTGSLGTKLRELRTRSKLGIKSVAPKVGVSYSYLSKIENDLKVPSLGLITELCKLYGEDADSLIAQAGILPEDIKQIVREHGKDAFDLLRDTYTNDS